MQKKTIIKLVFISGVILLAIGGLIVKAVWNFPGVGLYAKIIEPEIFLIAAEPLHEPMSDWQSAIGENFIVTYSNLYTNKANEYKSREKDINLFVDESVDRFLVNFSHLSWCFSSPCHTDEGNAIVVKVLDSNNNVVAKSKKGVDYKILKTFGTEQVFKIKLFWYLLPQSEQKVLVQWLSHDEFIKLKESLR